MSIERWDPFRDVISLREALNSPPIFAGAQLLFFAPIFLRQAVRFSSVYGP
jgi:hypothetical protein